MKLKFKKYPLLICLIVSAVFIVISLFIVGFFGIKLGVSLGGGSQIEVVLKEDVKVNDYVVKVDKALSKYGYKIDSVTVEDKYTAGENFGDYTTRCMLIKIAEKNISDKTKANIKADLIKNLGISEDMVSDVEQITASVVPKNVLFIGIAVGIIAIVFFVFGWLRYDIFAGLTFIVSYLHNLILCLSLIILTRVQLNIISLSVSLVLLIVLGMVIIHIFEKYREEVKLQTAEKISVTERMINCEMHAVKPLVIIGATAVFFAILLLFIPVYSVRMAALGIIFAIIVTVYTSLLIAPGIYGAMLEFYDANLKARLSRNDAVNKVIIKKKKASAKKQTKKASDEKTTKN